MKLSAIAAAVAILGSTMCATGVAATAAQSAQVQQLEATAKSAQAAIAASPQETKAMQSAIAAQSASAARTILLRHGFTAEQLADGVIVFSHAMLPKKVKPHEFYYLEIDHSPFKMSVHELP